MMGSWIEERPHLRGWADKVHELFAMADEAYQVSPAAVRGNLVNAALQDVATLPHKLGLTRRRDHRSEEVAPPGHSGAASARVS